MPKLQRLKNGTFIITIPKKIIEEMDWKAGDLIECRPLLNFGGYIKMEIGNLSKNLNNIPYKNEVKNV